LKDWRTTIGGALTSAGHMLQGIGLVPQLAGTPSRALTYICLAGFVLGALGTFFTGLFAADAVKPQPTIKNESA
jgi:hypothetical protein